MTWQDTPSNNPIRLAHEAGQRAQLNGPNKPPAHFTGLQIRAWWTGYLGNLPPIVATEPFKHPVAATCKGLPAIAEGGGDTVPAEIPHQSHTARSKPSYGDFAVGDRVRLRFGSKQVGTISKRGRNGQWCLHLADNSRASVGFAWLQAITEEEYLRARIESKVNSEVL